MSYEPIYSSMARARRAITKQASDLTGREAPWDLGSLPAS
jgi:hypothetical protein